MNKLMKMKAFAVVVLVLGLAGISIATSAFIDHYTLNKKMSTYNAYVYVDANYDSDNQDFECEYGVTGSDAYLFATNVVNYSAFTMTITGNNNSYSKDKVVYWNNGNLYLTSGSVGDSCTMMTFWVHSIRDNVPVGYSFSIR